MGVLDGCTVRIRPTLLRERRRRPSTPGRTGQHDDGLMPNSPAESSEHAPHLEPPILHLSVSDLILEPMSLTHQGQLLMYHCTTDITPNKAHMNRHLCLRLTAFCVALVLAGCTTDNLEPNALPGGGNPPLPVQALVASSDTVVASSDALLRSAAKNSNSGTSSTIPVKVLIDDDSEATIAIVKFDQASIAAALGSRILSTATLEFTVKESGTSSGGNDIDVRRVLKPWTEAGVTWKCGEDLKTSNSAADCPTTGWKIGANLDAFALARTARTHLSAGQTGTARFDVTADVQAFLAGTSNHGWVLHAATASSRALLWSRESPSKPRLVLSVTPATPVKLGVVLERGVLAATPLRDSTYSLGAVVSYSLGAAPGYRNVLATLDGRLVPASGTITMSEDHVLIASADSEVVVNPADETLLTSARGLLTASDPVAAYQDLLDRIGEFLDQVPRDEARSRLKAVYFSAFDPIADSAALRRVDAALANHVFHVRRIGDPNSSGLPAHSRGLVADAVPTAEATTFVYVNGILNDPEDAFNSVQQLRSLISEVSQFRDPAFQVIYFYNRNFSAEAESFAERVIRCVEMLERRSEVLGSRSRLVFMVQCIDDRTRNILTDADLVEAIGQYIDVVRNRPVVDIDARVLADTLHLLRARGRHVIAVPHSQGNLMIQQAVNDLRTTYGFSEERDSTCVAAVSLAAPTDRNWPLPEDRVKGILLRGDIVADWAGNAWPRMENDVTRAAEAEMAEHEQRLLETPDMAPYVAFRKLQLGKEIHNIVESYILPFESRQAIQDGLNMAYSSCAVGRVAVGPGNTTIPPGDSLQLSDTVYNDLGKQIFGHKLAWSSSSPGVASVDSTGMLRALVEGTTVISARAGPRTGNLVVNVGGPSPFPGKNVYGSWHGTIAAPQGGICPASLSISVDASMTLTCPGSEPLRLLWPVRDFPPHHVRVILRQTAFYRMEVALTGDGDTLEGRWWYFQHGDPDGVPVSFRRGNFPQ